MRSPLRISENGPKTDDNIHIQVASQPASSQLSPALLSSKYQEDQEPQQHEHG